MATPKELFSQQLMQLMQTATEVMDQVKDLENQYFDNGYNSGGADPIVDADLANFNSLTAANVSSSITAIQQLDNFFSNAVVTQADYAATFNAVRYAQLG